jgi:hypothetical protein
MLTKHLYRFDEVRSALLYSLKRKRLNEALYLLEELEESFYGGEARLLLFLSLCMCVGIKRLSWIEAWATQSQTREGRYTLCWQLIRCNEKDSSIWWLLWSIVVSKEKDPLLEKHGRLFIKWFNTCKQEDETVWQTCLDSSDDERVDTILIALQDDMKSYTIFAKACAVTILHGYKKVEKSSWSKLSSIDPLYESGFDTTLRNSRKYTIPIECLYGMTQRGAGVDTTEELRCLGSKDFQASAYWSKVWPKEVNDSTYEQFWDTYFPCDHPDEWSKEDQILSHGPGVPEGPLIRWWNNWIGSERLFVWGVPETSVLEWVKLERTTSISVLDRLLKLYKDFSCTPSVLYPIKKEFVLST